MWRRSSRASCGASGTSGDRASAPGSWSGAGADGGHWVPQHAGGGHHSAVVDAAWGFGDACLFTAGHDQTVRVFSSLPGGGWCEVARPQVRTHACFEGETRASPRPGS